MAEFERNVDNLENIVEFFVKTAKEVFYVLFCVLYKLTIDFDNWIKSQIYDNILIIIILSILLILITYVLTTINLQQ